MKRQTNPPLVERWCVGHAGRFQKAIDGMTNHGGIGLLTISGLWSVSFFSQFSFFCWISLLPAPKVWLLFYDAVVIVMMMIYVLIRFSLIYSCSLSSHKSVQIWGQAWLHATHATAKTPQGAFKG